MKQKELKELRKQHGLSQKELSEKLGVTPATLCHWENGTFKMTKIVKLAIAKILNIDYKMIKDNF